MFQFVPHWNRANIKNDYKTIKCSINIQSYFQHTSPGESLHIEYDVIGLQMNYVHYNEIEPSSESWAFETLNNEHAIMPWILFQHTS